MCVCVCVCVYVCVCVFVYTADHEMEGFFDHIIQTIYLGTDTDAI